MHGQTVILTHDYTDFDGLAAMLGAALLFPDAVPVLPRLLNRNVHDFVTLYKNQLPFIAPDDLPPTHFDQVILVDSRSASLPKGVRKNATYRCIDHHQSATAESDSARFQEIWCEALGATTTLVVERLLEQQLRPTALQATLLALGIHEDTGSLTFASTTARDVRALAWLLDCGANLAEINEFLHHPMSSEQRHLLEQLLAQSETIEVAGHSLVIAQVAAHSFSEALSPLASRLRDIFESDAIFLLAELGDMIQMVARSSTDTIDVGEIARSLGGGGHRRAAAAPMHNATLAEARQRILQSLATQSRAGITVEQIMSLGRPQMLDAELSIEEALTLMRRYGHEGFPVIERTASGGERLLGILTRREADRAWNHGFQRASVRRFMRAGSFTVRPDESVTQLRRLMVEHDWGQVPVVNPAGKIIGIVTRTDLIKLWNEAALPEHTPAEMAERMKAALQPTQHRILQLIGREVAEQAGVAYVVGGFVRDLFLAPSPSDTPPVHAAPGNNFDLDIVLEANAIDFALHIQEKFGGRVVTHRQFGTAKWILNDRDAPLKLPLLLSALALDESDLALPPSLDFVTARTEFYTEPTALPTVESSNIKLDLHRRDFTINTLALCLTPLRWATLLDFYGGVSDLEKGLVRVLHSLSFIDDPTRILRAVRYERRFGFQIEERTLQLLAEALELLERVSPARIRHEFLRIFQESAPEETLLRLGEVGVLQRLQPALPSDGWLADLFVRLRGTLTGIHPGTQVAPEWVKQQLQSEPIWRLYWALFVCRMPADALQALEDRLLWDKATNRLAMDLQTLESSRHLLAEPTLRPSQITRLLEKADLGAIALFQLTSLEESLLSERVYHYQNVWRHIRPEIGGAELRAKGIPQGPIYAQILEQLRDLRLDGLAKSREDEENVIEQIVKKL